MLYESTTTAVESTAVAVSKLAIGIEYNGAQYYGYQTQHNNLPTIQATVESALSQVAGGQPIQLSGAGRTDAQVHACEQVAHFQPPVARDSKAWLFGANRYLPKDISVLWVKEVAESFHARFSAQRRRYRYVIYSDPIRPALLKEGLTWTHKKLDVGRMHAAAQLLLGTQDFTSFRASECQSKSPIKTIDAISVVTYGRYVVLDVRADGFLHHMVRNIAGTLIAVGAAEKPIDWVAEVLAARQRAQAGITAPPYGLYLVQVEYPDEFALPQRELGPHFLSAMPDMLARV